MAANSLRRRKEIFRPVRRRYRPLDGLKSPFVDPVSRTRATAVDKHVMSCRLAALLIAGAFSPFLSAQEKDKAVPLLPVVVRAGSFPTGAAEASVASRS